MKQTKKFIVLLIFSTTACLARSQQELLEEARASYVDFDTSMQLPLFLDVVKPQDKIWGTWYAFFKKLYGYNNLSKVMPVEEPIIPKVIHQIWMGSPLPQHLKFFQDTVRLFHPDWFYILWTDEVIAEYKRQGNMINQDLFDAATNYGQKKDFLCIEVLHRFGGVYLDSDIASVRPLDLFHHCYHFYIGLQPLDTDAVQLGAGVIGSRAGHPFLKRCIEKIRTSNHAQIVVSTGPIFVTQNFIGYIMETNSLTSAALPASYFYPMGYLQKSVPEEAWLRPESFTIHYWEGSWLKPSGDSRNKKIK